MKVCTKLTEATLYQELTCPLRLSSFLLLNIQCHIESSQVIGRINVVEDKRDGTVCKKYTQWLKSIKRKRCNTTVATFGDPEVQPGVLGAQLPLQAQ